ncbi:probable LRR receptor-like serine/threonine-protein kinase At3g47570 isoform X2 [Vicia villosa]|uniref:probable LRR receptor-like serine/threonine-protein kinase At3g47570 isoform X2 n=1 Tax=Vicia villosa TaxID=3911 RepID=UPI00273AA188|nr:probable LRR receptor-like serine/threonine-protein kinase At3g47570 isoform X2 [Vicia villosa]
MRICTMFLLCFATQVMVYYMNSTTTTYALSLSSQTDKLALLALKEKITNGVPDSLPSWNHSLHFCDWEGVTCGRRHMRVSVLHLENQTWGGTLGPSLGNLTFLRILKLQNLALHGEIPALIGRLKRLQLLSLGNNKLQGEIPKELTNCTNIKVLELLENRFTGRVPTWFGSMKQLTTLIFENNNLVGTIPSSLQNVSSLQYLSLLENHLEGTIPYSLGNFSTHLAWLRMEFNQISGVIPKRIGQLTGLTYLSLGNNLFEGIIPDSIGNLTNLIRLDLQDNKLSGNIPTSIGNLTVLSELYLAQNKLEGQIPLTLRYCTQLQILNICDNKLSGDIPNQIFGYLKNLIFLYLCSNSLTGPIPLEFGNLDHLSLLDLHSNKFTGEIPKDLTSCMSLTNLFLGGNFFHGEIPSFLGSLKSLEFIDISHNKFSSTIPFELENLKFLIMLNLSFNNLYGEVPKRGVFSNVSAISLIGNKNLCGGISQLKLPPCLKVPSKKHKRSIKEKLIIISVIGGILISFIAFITVHFLTRKSKKLPSSPSLQNRALRVTYGELHEATNGFSSANLVGTGSFGSVYKGSLLNFGRPIAVKVLNLETRGAAKSFVAECNALGKMKHRNLVKILTCCSSVDYNGEDFKAIVFEFMSNGSLEKLLHDNEGSENHNLSLTQRVDIALDVAHALDYLHHDEDQVVVHCDIKPSNVLLDEDIVGHLGDFGLARLIHGAAEHSSKDQVSSSTVKGTIGYLPPEYGAGGPISSQGDIYSYGILVLEMLTGKRPTNNMFCENISLHQFCKVKIPEGILEIVDQRLLEPFAEDQTGIVENKVRKCLVMFAQIGVACSEEFPNQRMLIKDVIVRLNEIKSRLP